MEVLFIQGGEDDRGQEVCPRFRDTESRAQSSGGHRARGLVAAPAPVTSLSLGGATSSLLAAPSMQPVARAPADTLPNSFGGLYTFVTNCTVVAI